MAQLPEYQRSVKIEASNPPTGFGQAAASIASQTTTLGEIGAQMAQTGAMTFAREMGYNRGKNPSGELLPPITDFDKQYAQSYMMQANATLNLQATNLLKESQLQVNRGFKLTPESVSSVSENVTKGLQDIASLAPEPLRGEMQNSFALKAAEMSGNLQLRLEAQQKQEQKELFNLSQKNNVESIYNSNMSSDVNAAREQLDTLIAANQEKLNLGMITPSQADANIKSGRMAFYGSYYTQLASIADDNNQLDQFLRGFAEKKPDELTPEEHVAVGKQVVSYFSAMNALRTQNQSVRSQELTNAINSGEMTAEGLAAYQDDVTPLQYQQLKGQLIKASKKQNNTLLKQSELANDWQNNAGNQYKYKKQEINDFYNSTKQALMANAERNGQPVNEDDAALQVASSTNFVIPAFVDETKGLLNSGNPEDAIRGATRLQRVEELERPSLTASFTQNDFSLMHALDRAIRLNDENPIKAAYDMVYGKKSEQMQTNMEVYSDYKKKNLNTAAKQNAFVKKLYEVPDGAIFSDPLAFNKRALNDFKFNMLMYNNDETTAIDATKKGLRQFHGMTKINGQGMVDFNPVEKITQTSAPIIREQAYEQLKKQLAPTNELFNKDKRQQPFAYEFPDRPTHQDIIVANDRLAQIKMQENAIAERSGAEFRSFLTGGKRLSETHALSGDWKALQEERKKNEKIISDYMDDKPLKIIKVLSNGDKEEINLAIASTPFMQATNDPSKPLVGHYQVLAMGKNGNYMPLNKAYDLFSPSITYIPKQDELNEIKNRMQLGANEIYNDYLTFFDDSSKPYDTKGAYFDAAFEAVQKRLSGEIDRFGMRGAAQ